MKTELDIFVSYDQNKANPYTARVERDPTAQFTDMYGTGTTAEAAVRDLHTTILELHCQLKEMGPRTLTIDLPDETSIECECRRLRKFYSYP